MNLMKQIIVEFNSRRQRFTLKNHLILTSKLLLLIGEHFNIEFNENSSYLLQMYDYQLNEYFSLNDEQQIFHVDKDIEHLHRFRIIKYNFQLEKFFMLNNLQMTVGKLNNVKRNMNEIQNLVRTLNHNCNILKQMIRISDLNLSSIKSSSNSSYLFDPSSFKNIIENHRRSGNYSSDDENFDSVSCIALPNKSNNENNIQLRIIPCKYAIRSTCHLGDKCLYLHDEECLRFAREWERNS